MIPYPNIVDPRQLTMPGGLSGPTPIEPGQYPNIYDQGMIAPPPAVQLSDRVRAKRAALLQRAGLFVPGKHFPDTRTIQPVNDGTTAPPAGEPMQLTTAPDDSTTVPPVQSDPAALQPIAPALMGGKGGSQPAKGGKSYDSPSMLERRRKMAEQLMGQGMDTSPIASPWQGAARLADALVGGMGMKNADQQEREGHAAANQAVMQAFENGAPDNATMMNILGNSWADPEQKKAALLMWQTKNRLGMQKYGMGQPIVRRDEQGNLHLYQLNNMGGAEEIQFPAGTTYAPKDQIKDYGTYYGGVDPYTQQMTPITQAPGSQPPSTLGGQPQQPQPQTSAQPIPQPMDGQQSSVAAPAGRPAQKDIAGKAAQQKYGTTKGEQAATQPQAQMALQNSLGALSRLSGTAQEIQQSPGLDKITGIMGLVPNWPGGEAANTQAKLDQLKSEAAFTVLQAMRDASKTGGAVGQVSNFEEQMLQDNLAALSRAQSADEYRRQLQKITNFANVTSANMQFAYQQTYGGAPGLDPNELGDYYTYANKAYQAGVQVLPMETFFQMKASHTQGQAAPQTAPIEMPAPQQGSPQSAPDQKILKYNPQTGEFE